VYPIGLIGGGIAGQTAVDVEVDSRVVDRMSEVLVVDDIGEEDVVLVVCCEVGISVVENGRVDSEVGMVVVNMVVGVGDGIVELRVVEAVVSEVGIVSVDIDEDIAEIVVRGSAVDVPVVEAGVVTIGLVVVHVVEVDED
jgi:hypothetical protein